MLEVAGLHAYYGDSHVLQGIDLEIGEGEAVSLLGRNGAGKTTTIAAIVGFLRPREGRVRVAGRDLTGARPHEVARAGVALVPQGRRIFADLTVHENLALTARERDGGRATRTDASGWDLGRVLELFPSLRARLDHHGDELSGGEQQMLAIGRALMRDPRILLLDEPSEGLAPKLVDQVREVLVRLRERGLPLLLVEQNLALATAVAQRVYVMSKGRIVFSGTPAELASDPEVESRYLGV